MDSYSIFRYYWKADKAARLQAKGYTYKQAVEHCRKANASSRTCTKPKLREHTEAHGPWFDGFMLEETS